MTTNYFKRVFLFILLGLSTSLFSQNIGINTSGTQPSSNAILDLNTGNNTGGPPSTNNALGLDIPNVYIAALNTFSPPILGAATASDLGMLVYNINASIGSGTGYYCWNGASWVAVSGAAASTMWLILGNNNIVDGSNFIGTTNTVPINFQVNGSKSGRIDAINYNTFLGYQSGNSTTAATTGSYNAGYGNGALFANTSGAYNTGIGASALISVGANGSNTGVGYGALSANTGTGNTGIGYEPLYNATSGTYNFAGGYLPMGSGVTTGSYNAALGYEALYANTTGIGNVGIGYEPLLNETAGSYNSAIGYLTMGNGISSGSYNNAQGYQALYNNSSGAGNLGYGYQALMNGTTGSYNAALGYQAMGLGINTASYNAALGYEALYSNTTGTANIALGYLASSLGATAAYNTAIGYEAQYDNIGNASYNNTIGYLAGYEYTGADNYNNSMGYEAGYYNSGGLYNNALGYYSLYGAIYGMTGSYNNAVGYYSMYENGSGAYNNALGGYAMYAYYSGSYNNGIGYQALYGVAGSSSGTYNNALGYNALHSNTSGSGNSALGYYSLYSNGGNGENVGIGYYAGEANTGGYYDVAIGYNAQGSNTGGAYYNNSIGYYAGYQYLSTYYYNNDFGYYAGYYHSGGYYNTAIGAYAQQYNSGYYNNAMGYYALYGDYYGVQSGYYNTAIGYYAMYANYTGYGNNAIGGYAMYGNYSGSYNNAFGYNALYGSLIAGATTGSYNNAIGYGAGYSNTVGSRNNAIGYEAMYSNTNGSANVGIGDSALFNNTTGSYNTAIGFNAKGSAANLTNFTAIGNGATASGSNLVVLGNTAVSATEFNGALMPYYSAAYNAGAAGQVLTSQGAGAAPQWVNAGGTANNGLSVSGGTIQLGGALVQNTSVTASAGNYKMNYDLGTGIAAGNSNFTITNGGSGNPYIAVVNSGNAGNTGQVGIGTSLPNGAAALDVTSSWGGVLLPRLTTAAINAIASPAYGLVVFNSTTNCMELYAGSWQVFGCGCVPLAAPGAISGPTLFCAGATGQTYTCGSVSGAVSYVWSINPSISGTSITGTGTSATVNFAATPATYTISAADINAGGCQSGYANYTVIVSATPATPPVPAGPINPTYITVQTYTIPTTPGYTYTWSSSNTNIGTLTATAGTATVTFSASAGQTNICVFATNNGCVGSPSCLSVTSLACVPGVNLDASVTGTGGITTWTITTTHANELIMIAADGWNGPQSQVAGTVTVNGNNATFINSGWGSNSSSADIWAYVAPTAGSYSIACTEAGFNAVYYLNFAASFYGGCNTLTLANITPSTGTYIASGTITLSLSTTIANSYIYATASFNEETGSVVWTGATQLGAQIEQGSGITAAQAAVLEASPGSYTITSYEQGGTGGMAMCVIHP